MSKLAETFRNRLSLELSAHGDIVAAARKSQISRKTFDHWLAGRRVPDLDQVEAVAINALGKDPAHLLFPDKLPEPRVPADLLALLELASPDQLAAVRALLEGFAIGKERAASGKPAKKLPKATDQK